VNGTFRFRTVQNDGDHKPLPVEEVLPPGTFDLRAVLDDGTAVSVTYRDDGTFTFPITYPGQRYRVLASAGGVSVEWQHTVTNLALAIQTAGRRNRRPVTQTYVTFNYPAQAVGVHPAHLASTGVYTMTYTGQYGAPALTFDWRLSGSVGGPLGLLDASANDFLYALQFQTITDTPEWYKVVAVSQQAVSQAIGTNATLPQPAAVTDNTCFKLSTDGDAERMRLQSTHPRPYLRSAGDWYAYSVPAPTHVGIQGHTYAATSQFMTARNVDITRSFHDPFPGTTLVLAAGVNQFFLMQLGSASSVEVANSSRTFVVAARGDASCNVGTTRAESTGAIAGRFLFDGVELEDDNQPVTIDPDRPPLLTWSLLAPGDATNSVVNLFEIAAIDNKTTLIQRWAASTYGETAIIDPAQLEDGHTYSIQVTTGRGRVNAASGDFVTLELPIHQTSIWTRTFLVRR
jgi:hypothetical protein